MIISVRGGPRDRGSVALETILLAPALLLLFGIVIVAGRVSLAHGSVEAAARDAARQASISRDPGTATRRARESAQQSLRNEGLDCPAEVTVNAAGLNRPVGETAEVTVRVVCTVNLADIGVPGLPGARTLTAEFSSPIDPYRGETDR